MLWSWRPNARTDRGARDGRSLDHATLEQLRLRAFERVEAGESIASVARTLGFDAAVVSRWVSKARREGAEALHAKPITGRPPSLDDRQVGLIRELIVQIPASFWGFASELWTRAMVAHVIERVFGVTLGERAVGQIMRHRMGLTPQRPVRRALRVRPGVGPAVDRGGVPAHPPSAPTSSGRRSTSLTRRR